MSVDEELIPDELTQSILGGLSEKDHAAHSPEETIYILGEIWAGRTIGNLMFAAEYQWAVAWTDEFESQTSRLDRKLKGRILDAIGDIAKEPMTPRGDTIMPLTGRWAGNWRYRTGNFRLIYFPDKTRKTIKLVTIEPREKAYKQK
jgi:mRNA-degrading endonuclease RelE of RelBE toxin-antitoxin system